MTLTHHGSQFVAWMAQLKEQAAFVAQGNLKRSAQGAKNHRQEQGALVLEVIVDPELGVRKAGKPALRENGLHDFAGDAGGEELAPGLFQFQTVGCEGHQFHKSTCLPVQA